MIIELYPKIDDIIHNIPRVSHELYFKLEKYVKEKINIKGCNLSRCMYTEFFSQDGIYTIVNDQISHSQNNSLYKNGLKEPIVIKTSNKEKENYISLCVNYIEDDTTKKCEYISYFDYNHISEKRIQYTFTKINNSHTSCNFIFNENRELIDLYFKTKLPIKQSTNNVINIECLIRECLENNETLTTNIYNEDICSLYLTIINII